MDRSNKILFVASLNPFSIGGGSQATHAYLDATIDCYGRENVVVMIGDETNIPEKYKNLEYIRVKQRSSIKSTTEYIFGFLSRFTKPLITYMKEHKNEFKICIINGSVVGGKAIKALNKINVKTVMIYHNYEVEYHRDNKTKESLKGHFLSAIRYTEKLSYKYASLNMFLTKDDEDIFKREYGEPSGVNYILGTFDIKEQKEVNVSSKTKEYDLVISGSLGNYQTTVGINDFYSNYMNIAEEVIKNIRVLFTGRNPSTEICKIQKQRPDIISIIPNPDNIYEIVQMGSIYLCPTCIGGGLKLRAMDGLRCGLPVLAHKVSARGYDYFFNKPYYKVYSDDKSFRQGLKEIISWVKNNPMSQEKINKEYYLYFGYNAGLDRFRDAMALIEK